MGAETPTSLVPRYIAGGNNFINEELLLASLGDPGTVRRRSGSENGGGFRGGDWFFRSLARAPTRTSGVVSLRAVTPAEQRAQFTTRLGESQSGEKGLGWY